MKDETVKRLITELVKACQRIAQLEVPEAPPARMDEPKRDGPPLEEQMEKPTAHLIKANEQLIKANEQLLQCVTAHREGATPLQSDDDLPDHLARHGHDLGELYGIVRKAQRRTKRMFITGLALAGFAILLIGALVFRFEYHYEHKAPSAVRTPVPENPEKDELVALSNELKGIRKEQAQNSEIIKAMQEEWIREREAYARQVSEMKDKIMVLKEELNKVEESKNQQPEPPVSSPQFPYHKVERVF